MPLVAMKAPMAKTATPESVALDPRASEPETAEADAGDLSRTEG